MKVGLLWTGLIALAIVGIFNLSSQKKPKRVAGQLMVSCIAGGAAGIIAASIDKAGRGGGDLTAVEAMQAMSFCGLGSLVRMPGQRSAASAAQGPEKE